MKLNNHISFSMFLAIAFVVNACVTAPKNEEMIAFEKKKQQQAARMYRETWARAHDAARLPVTNELFWRVESPNGKVSHLLGTMHVGIDFSELSSRVYREFDRSEIVVIESDAERRDIEMTSGKDMSEWFMEDQDLPRFLGDQNWAKLCSALLPFCSDQLKRLHPDIARVLYMRSLASQMITGSACLDCQIHEVARQTGKTLRFLETAEELRPILFSKNHLWFDQEYIEKRDPAVAAAELKKLLESDASKLVLQEQLRTFDLAVYYRQGNLNQIQNEFAKSEAKDFYRVFIKGRNEAWMKRLEPLVKDGNAFIAVGAAHMVGESSIIDLLRKKGYKIQRIN